MSSSIRRLLVLILLAAFSAPSPGTWARPLRHARRQAAHTRRTKRAPVRTAGAAPCVPADAAAVSEAQFSPSQSVYDPFDDDDHRMKKGRRRRPADSVISVTEPYRVRPASGLIAVIRERLEPRHTRPGAVVEPLPHFGSGPCHSIPRPREGTLPAPASDVAVA